MDKIAIALVIIALTAGLLGGYGLGYYIYEPQLRNLQNEVQAVSDEFNSLTDTVTSMGNVIANLNETTVGLGNTIDNLNASVETIENRSWHEVYSIEASEDITSNNFHLKGRDIRVTWIFMSFDATAELTVYMYFANGTLYAWWGDSGTWSVDNAEMDHAEAGDYYISIVSLGMIYYFVAVHDYY